MNKADELYKKIHTFENFMLAWEKVEENHGCAGVDGVTIEDFELRLRENIESLVHDLANKCYQPSQLLRIDIEKEIGGNRRLLIPTVRDRLAQTAGLNIINPLLEQELETCSFAYRKGKSIKQAAYHIKECHEEGYCWAVNADIDDFFDEVNHHLLLSRLREVIQDEEVLKLIRSWLKARVYDRGVVRQLEKGLPQGSPISPALSNLYLDKFDEELLRKKQRMIRFSDNILILCKDKPDAEKSLELTKDLLKPFLLHLDEKKTTIDHFDQGFEYLGNLFVRSIILPLSKDKKSSEKKGKKKSSPDPVFYHQPIEKAQTQPGQLGLVLQKALAKASKTPSSLISSHTPVTTHESESHSEPEQPINLSISHPRHVTTREPEPRSELRPFMRALYLQEQGCVIGRADERLVISKGEQILAEIPTIKIDQIIVFGNSHLTTPALKLCLTEGIPIFLLSNYGKYYGVIDPFQYKNMELQRVQFMKSMDEEFCLKLSLAIIQGKIHNARVLLQRYNRRKADIDLTSSIEALNRTLNDLPKADTLEKIRGYEGTAARFFYEGYSQLFPDDFNFTKRTRQPPTDPINSLLSFGYTLLFYNIFSLACINGLNPYYGFLHPARQGHPALISDLIEEFRSPVIDSLCLYLLNGRILKQEDFYWKKEEANACYLSPLARKTFIKYFETKISTQIQHPYTGFTVDYRKCISLQVQEMCRYIKGESEEYKPMVVR